MAIGEFLVAAVGVGVGAGAVVVVAVAAVAVAAAKVCCVPSVMHWSMAVSTSQWPCRAAI